MLLKGLQVFADKISDKQIFAIAIQYVINSAYKTG